MAEPDVYFAQLPDASTPEERGQATEAILKASGLDNMIERNDKVAVKLHVGERDGDTYVKPHIIRLIVDQVKAAGGLPFLTETSTLYRGRRSNAVDHIIQAVEHGFTIEATGAPFVMADGLAGNSEIEIAIPGEIFDKVNIAREVVFTDVLVTVSHATGHGGMALAACLKNLGMGLASRIGKLRQHSSVKPFVDSEACTFCQKCIRWCPVDAIVEKAGKAFIVEETCIGCGECLAVCNDNAVRYNWGTESADLQKRVAEHALGVIQDKRDKCLMLNFLYDMTKGCDCGGNRQKPCVPDVGVVASLDPVAVDQATLDLTEKAFGMNLSKKINDKLDPEIQLDHGEKIGLGSRSYKLTAI